MSLDDIHDVYSIDEIIEDYYREQKQQISYEFRRAHQTTLSNVINTDFAGKHAKVRFPELAVTMYNQLYMLVLQY